MKRSIYFSGVASGPSLQPTHLTSLAEHYIPLDSMDDTDRHVAFLMWLGIVYLNRTDHLEFRDGVEAKDDPLLVFQFSKEYEAGAWRELGRGMTLEECARLFEFSTGKRIICLINAAGPRLPTARIDRKLILDAGAILDLAAVYYRIKSDVRRRPWPAVYYDGKTGHCISLFDADPEGQRFGYHDPWPGRSLLCKENNVAGINANWLGRSQLHFGARAVEADVWGISREELGRVLVALYVPLTDWTMLMSAMSFSSDFPQQLRSEIKGALTTQEKGWDEGSHLGSWRRIIRRAKDVLFLHWWPHRSRT